MLHIILGAVMLGVLWSLTTIGVYIAYRILDIADLTAEGSIALGAAIAAQAIHLGLDPYSATFLAVVGGAAAGFIAGFLHTRLKIPPLLAGILCMIAIYSINLRIMGRANLSLLRLETIYSSFSQRLLVNSKLSFLMEHSQAISVIVPGLLIVCSVVLLLFWFFHTELGTALRAAGDNPQMARALGINTDNMILLGLMISNSLIALSGALIAQQQSYADIQLGVGSIVMGLASLIIGETILNQKGFLSSLLSLVLGSISYRLIIAFVLELGMPPQDLKLFTALTVVFTLSLPQFKAYLHSLRRSANAPS